MSIISSLRANAQALNVHSAATRVAGDNIANANDPSYARKRAILGEREALQLGGGNIETQSINIKRIEQVRDEILDNQIVRETMTGASLEAKASYLARLESAYGEQINRDSSIDTLSTGNDGSTAGDGLSKNLDDFFTSFAELASAPNELALRQDLVSKAETLVAKFNDFASDINDLETDLRRDIDSSVVSVNTLLSQIGDLNNKIGAFEVNDFGSATDARDQRQKLVEDLAELINFEVDDNISNPSMIDIVLKDGNGLSARLVEGGNVPADLSFDAINNTITYPITNAPMDITGGAIHGMIEVRSESIDTLRSEIDALAHQVVISVNSAYNPTYDDGTSPGPSYVTTGDFFARPATGSVATAATIALDTNPAQPPAYPAPPNDAVVPFSVDTLKGSDAAGGGNDIAQAVSELAEYVFSTDNAEEYFNGSFTEYLAGVTTRVGNEIFSNEQKLDNQETINAFLDQQRQSTSGVNMDEELTNILQFQRSFQGTSRVINVLDSLLELVVSGLIR